MKAAFVAISVLFAAGLVAGFVFPPEPSAAHTEAAADLVPPGTEPLYVGQPLVARALASASPAASAATADVEVSLGDVVGAMGLLVAAVVVVAIWVRARNPVTRITHHHDDDDAWNRR